MLAAPALASAAISPKLDFTLPAMGPFPSDAFTTPDPTQLTDKRVDLPKPLCVVFISACQDIDIVNTLDGFNLQPRITVPFTGDIRLASVTSDTVFLINLDTGTKVGINQRFWDGATQTLAFHPDELLCEHTRYLLVVTKGVLDSAGAPIAAGDYRDILDTRSLAYALKVATQARLVNYWTALNSARFQAGVNADNIAVASVFTTQSVSADLIKIHDQLQPGPLSIATVVHAAQLASMTGAVYRQQTDNDASAEASFKTTTLPIIDIKATIGTLAYGTFTSPLYQAADLVTPAVGSRTGTPVARSTNALTFQLFLPRDDNPRHPKPASGWPVTIFGHGFLDSLYGGPWAVAASLAEQGIAVISINAVGHGGGPAGTLELEGAVPPVPLIPAPGRGFDAAGAKPLLPFATLFAYGPKVSVFGRDSVRQTVVDLMQLVQQIKGGIHLAQGGGNDLDPANISYAGQSLGGIYGTLLLAIDADVKRGVLNVPGGSINDVLRLGSVRPLEGLVLAFRAPGVLNGPVVPTGNALIPLNFSFDENMPLRNEIAARVNSVAGAPNLQEVFDRNEWVQQSSNPAAYAHLLLKTPAHGPKSVLVQFANGDQTVPNPTTTALLRAGGLAAQAALFRNELAFAGYAARNSGLLPDPHTFLTNVSEVTQSIATLTDADKATANFVAHAAQRQMATFLASGKIVMPPLDDPARSRYFQGVQLTANPEGLVLCSASSPCPLP